MGEVPLTLSPLDPVQKVCARHTATLVSSDLEHKSPDRYVIHMSAWELSCKDS